MKYFEIFDLEPSLKVDPKALKKKYYKLSKSSHPDYFTQSEEDVQQEKLQQSSLINDAYKTLKHREARIKYILDQKGMLEEGEQEVPQSFLMDMMEINEALMELEMDYDEDQFESSMNDIQAFEETLENNFQKIAKMWEEAGFDNIPSELYEDLKDYYLKNRYLLRIKENLSKFASR